MQSAAKVRRSDRERRRLVTAAVPRARILDAFAARAREVGVSSVVMSELAASLGMSKKTLYQHFESKDALVQALVRAWGEELEQGMRSLRSREGTTLAYFRGAAELWVDALSRFSSAFWAEVQSDHPAAHATFVTLLLTNRRRLRGRIAQSLRSGVHREIALEVLNATVTRAANPALAARLGLSTRDTLMAALEIWARGALRSGSPRPQAR